MHARLVASQHRSLHVIRLIEPIDRLSCPQVHGSQSRRYTSAITPTDAQVVELADTGDLKSPGRLVLAGSSPALGTDERRRTVSRRVELRFSLVFQQLPIPLRRSFAQFATAKWGGFWG